MKKKYRITLEDESSLDKRVNFSAPYPILLLLFLILIVAAGLLGIFILASTPLKNYLPGYLKESERTATEEQHLRLDSLVQVYEINEAYVKGILEALNPSDIKRRDSLEKKPLALNPDSLLPISSEEMEFMEMIRERDKFNINYTSPAAAQTMMFGTLNPAAVITGDSQENFQAEYLLPIGAPVSAIADGKVISITSSPQDLGSFEIIIQHPKGFLSRTSKLKNTMVHTGDRVTTGQIIANSTQKKTANSNSVVLELWHDGDPLLPSQYIVK